MELINIKAARSNLDLYDNIEILEDIFEFHERYFIKISIRIDESQSSFVPLITNWHVKFGENKVDFYPSKDRGITATFQHQSLNYDAGEEYPFLMGKLCLDRPIHVFDNQSFKYLPANYSERFLWYLNRAIKWITLAAKNALVREGDPFELPEIPLRKKNEFLYKENDLDKWSNFTYNYGFAQIDKMQSTDRQYYVLRELYDVNYEEARGTLFWGNYFENLVNVSRYSMWVKLQKPPIMQPWMFPKTWEDLFNLCNEQGIEIKKILRSLLIKSEMLSAGKFLAIAFTIPKFYGGEDKIVSWLFIDLPEFKYPQKGFRQNISVKAKYYIDRLKGVLSYYDSENLDTTTLFSRGQINPQIAQQDMAIIGLGALGSMLSEVLSRIGVESLSLYDSDVFLFSNSARHILNLDSNGKNKSQQIKEKIIKNNPNLQVKCYSDLTLDNIRSLEKNDIVIDCSASSEVLSVLNTYTFKKDKLFVIASMNYGATDFIIYFYKGKKFDNEDYSKKILPIYKKLMEKLNLKEKDLIMQGIGCYHPIFPARFDDVSMWANMLIKTIELKYIRDFTRGCVHLRRKNLSVEVVNEWEN